MKDLGQRFIQIRKKIGVTQKEFAASLGVSIGAVQAYEGNQIPKGEVLGTLLSWGYNLNWLFTGKGTMQFLGDKESYPIDAKIMWNVAYYICKRTEAADDNELFADVFLEIYKWMEMNQQKPETEQASAETTAEIIDFAMQRLNAG